MAARNAKPSNSSDSETEWTFIDSYDGTIEARSNCVTYRKPTYSEAVRGVNEEDLAEVESEPEFEVLASFQFRSKGETFGVGSSVPKSKRSPKTKRKLLSTETLDDERDEAVDDDILVISTHGKPEKPVKPVVDLTVGKKSSAKKDDGIVVVDEGYGFDDVVDDVNLIDLSDSHVDDDWLKTGDSDDMDDDDEYMSKDLTDEALNISFINTSLFNICIDDDDDDDDDIVDDEDGDYTEDQPDDSSMSDVEPVPSPVNKWLICMDTLESNRDLAWDNLTFKLMNTMPLMMVSTSAADNLLDSSKKSYDNLDDLYDSDIPLIPEWFFNPHYQPLVWDDFSDEFSFELVEDDDYEHTIPNWLYDQADAKDSEDFEPLIPNWFYDPNHNTCEDTEDYVEPLIPSWLYDQNHSTHNDIWDGSDFSDSDWESDYTDDSEDDDDDDDSSVVIPDWLFGERKNKRQQQDDDNFLFSQLFVDVPTFIILLFLTTALGFSIGHGLTVYLSTHAFTKTAKGPGSTTQPNSIPNLDQRMLTAEEIAKVDLLKLEDEIYRQRENDLLSSHLRYDLKDIHKNLRAKHNRLLRSHKSTEDRLHISKSMSWFWRLKYDHEKRKNVNTTSVVYLQKQLERIGSMYAKEKTIADKWRRMQKIGFSFKNNESSDLRKPVTIDTLKASLASKYWVQTILSSRAMEWDEFKKRWTEDSKKLKNDSCSTNRRLALKRKLMYKDPFRNSQNEQTCKKVNNLSQPNSTVKKRINSIPADKKKMTNVLRQKVFGPTIPTGPPEGPPKRIHPSMFDVIKLKRRSKKGETARRRRESIRKERLKKKEQRRKALEVEHQVREMKTVLAELRKERRMAEKEKHQLEASWRKLQRQRENFEKEKEDLNKREKTELNDIKSELKKTKTRLKTWKLVAVQFKKNTANLQRDMKQIDLNTKKSKELKSIKRDLKIEKRKLRKQRQDLKALKQRMRKEHRNYAREGWKLIQKQKKLEKIQTPANISSTSSKSCRKRYTKHKRISKICTMKQRRKQKRKLSKRKKSGKSKKSRWKQKETFIKYWATLEKTLKNWTESLNKTIKEKSSGKVKKVWKKLQDKIANFINLDWRSKKESKSPFQSKKKSTKKKKKNSKSEADTIYQKILAEQLKFDKEKQREIKESEKKSVLKTSGPLKKPKKKGKKHKNPGLAAKQRRKKQRRKYQRERERLQQWALQMNERKLEHERIYKDRDQTRSTKARYKSKPNEIGKEVSSRDIEADDFDASSNLTNTLMLLVQPQLGDQYESYTKLDPGTSSFFVRKQSVLNEITMAQLKHNKKQQNTELAISLDDDSVISQSKRPLIQEADDGQEQSIKPTPPLPNPALYNKLPLLGVLDSNKGVSIGLPVPPPSLNPTQSLISLNKDESQPKKFWDRSKQPEKWITPPSPPTKLVKSDGSWSVQRSTDRSEQRQQQGAKKGISNVHNQFDTEFVGRNKMPEEKSGIWAFARASGRAQQRILFEPLNRQNFKKMSKEGSSKTYFNRRRRIKDKDGTWTFQRASDREEQRRNKEPWYVRRAEGRENDRDEDHNSWFIERGFEREVQRQENPEPLQKDPDIPQERYDDDDDNGDYDDFYDDDFDDGDFYHIDFEQEGYDDVAAA